jgi:hypothetical protein
VKEMKWNLLKNERLKKTLKKLERTTQIPQNLQNIKTTGLSDARLEKAYTQMVLNLYSLLESNSTAFSIPLKLLKFIGGIHPWLLIMLGFLVTLIGKKDKMQYLL